VIRRLAKQSLAAVSHATGALHLIRAARRVLRGPVVRIFGYHRVVPDVAAAAARAMAPLCVSTAAFAAQLDHLTAHYDVLPLAAAAAALAGRRRLRRDTAVVTFDDGYHDVLEHALPLCAERGVPATVFVTTCAVDGHPLPHDRLYALLLRARRARVRLLGSVLPDSMTWPLARADLALARGATLAAAEAILCALTACEVGQVCDALARRLGEPERGEIPRYLDWDDLARLRAGGVEVGAHTATHTHLPLDTDETLVAELVVPRATIAERLGTSPSALAYPAGRHDARVRAAAAAAGYTVALTTEDRENLPGCDVHRLGRKVLADGHGIGVHGEISPALVAAHLDGLFALLHLSPPQPGDFRLEAPWT